MLGVHDLRTRQSGHTIFVQLHLELADSLPLAVAHAIGDAVESAIENEFPGAEILIHQDPVSAVAQERRRMLAHQMGERAGR